MDGLKERIKIERIKKEMNQPQLAKIMNVSKQTVSHWETGDRIPDAITITKLADLFNVTTDYLFGRTDDGNVIIVKDNVNGDDIEIGVDKNIYPDGLSHEDVLEILETWKKMSEAGLIIKKDDK